MFLLLLLLFLCVAIAECKGKREEAYFSLVTTSHDYNFLNVAISSELSSFLIYCWKVEDKAEQDGNGPGFLLLAVLNF